VYEHNRVADEPHRGRTLAELTAEHGLALLGRRAGNTPRFPLLIKLLDCADWLSVQVHPNDEQAERLEGAGHFGKTEAWHILEAEPGARVISGLKPGATKEALAQALREGALTDWLHYLPVEAGDTIFTRAGTIHALGPGLLLYEVQQTSDITYRVFDWNRPPTAGRALHLEQSLAVADPAAMGQATPCPPVGDGEERLLTACPYFALDLLAGETRPIELDTSEESFHALTVIEGQARVEGQGWRQTLSRFETAVIPAACGAYRVEPMGAWRALKARVG